MKGLLKHPPSNQYGLWSEGGGKQHLVARTGSQAPGTPDGVQFSPVTSGYYYPSGFDAPVIAGGGRIAFAAKLIGPGVNSTNDSGFWAEDLQGFLKLLVRAGMHAPGMSPGVVFDTIGPGTPSLNSLGQVVFQASVGGPSFSEQGTIWWADVETGSVEPLVLPGQLIEVRPGDFRSVSLAVFPDQYGARGHYASGGQDGRPTALNDNGQFAFVAQFTDGSSGVFVASIPEPAATACFAVLGVAALSRRRRRVSR